MLGVKKNARAEQIKNGENRFLEFKVKLPSPENIAKTAIAFSNGAGGEILIGVDDKKNIIGIGSAEIFELQDKISNIIYDMCHPVIIPEMFIETIHDVHILVIKIIQGGLKPYYLKKDGKNKGTYIRIGATNKLADIESINELERRRRNISFDEEIDYDYDFTKLDYSFLVRIFKDIKNQKINLNDLINFKLVKKENDKLYATNAFLIIAGIKDNVYSNCARFKGITTENFIDKKEFTGNIFDQLENIEIFLKNHLKLNSKIIGLTRDDNYEIPFIALREAVINAFVHRDYSRRGSNIKIAIFDDCIEITSPGVLPNSISLDTILTEGRSEIRNTVVARIFKELNYIEQWGTGMGKIKNSCAAAHLKLPQIKENGGYTQVVIFRPADTGGCRRMPADTDGYRRIPADTDGLSELELKGKISELADQQANIIKYVRENEKIDIKKVMGLFGIKESRARELVSELVKKGHLLKKGAARNTYYIIGE